MKAMIGKRIRPRARGRKRSAASCERMRQAARRREARRLRVKLHELRTRRLFPSYHALQRIRDRIEGTP
jgi:hypothetical protein